MTFTSTRLLRGLALLFLASPLPELAAQDSLVLGRMRWRMIGPNRGGRVTSVTGVPSLPTTFYMGVASGGVWKTTDAGATWNPITDRDFQVASIGAISVYDGDPNIVYVGTGSDGLRSNVSTGRGVYRSNDAGQTWTFIGLRDVGQIGAVRIHPQNPDIVYVSATGNIFKRNTDRGIFRTKDGGKTWQKILYLSDSTGASDVELMPGNPNVVYAVMTRSERKPWTIISGAMEGGVYKSTDGGDNWTKLAGGLPNQLVGKGNIGVTPANPQRLYLLYEAKPGSGLYRSDDAGATWSLVNGMPNLITRPFYYTTLTADPTNADIVYAGAEGFYKCTEAGRTCRNFPTPHGDNHDLWINPRDADVMIQSNDGGANVSLNGGRTWSTQYNQPTAEIYQVYLDNQFPYRLYGAQQDNTTLIVPSLPLGTGMAEEWRTGPGCETGPIMPHPTNPDTVYASCKGQYSRMYLRSGQEKQYWIGAQSLYSNPGKDLIYRFQRVSPMEMSPHNPRVLYYGSQFVHRTVDEGVTWEKISPDLTWYPPEHQQKNSGEPITLDGTGEENYSTLYAIEESPTEPGVIWTGANDGPWHVTRDNGKSWTNVTPKDMPQGCRVGTIDPSPHRKGAAYYAAYCYLLGDFAPYFYKTNDYGKSWTKIVNGIPGDSPTRALREDATRPGLLFGGTEFGMYVSLDDGANWTRFNNNLPVVPINDIKIHRGDLIIATQGRGFWIMDNLSPLYDRQFASTGYLFKPRDQYRMRYSGGGGFGRGGPWLPQYPQAGAQIDYYVPANYSGEVKLEVLDAKNAVIRTFSSEAPGRPAGGGGGGGGDPDEDMRPAFGGGGQARPSKAPGLNRFTWDLRYPGPWNAATNAPAPGGGPTAVPGQYQVRLTLGGAPMTRSFTLREDPRVTEDGVTQATLQEQFDIGVKVRDLVSDANKLAARVRDAKRANLPADIKAQVDAVEAQLITPPIRYSKPELLTHITYLFSLTNQADQKLGRDVTERYTFLKAELDRLTAAMNKAVPPPTP